MTQKRKATIKSIKVEREGRYGRFKSRKALRQISIKTPGGRTVIRYRIKKSSKAHCAECGSLLQGVPHELPSKMKNTAKTAKRPERPYGGYLCSQCARKKIIEEARASK